MDRELYTTAYNGTISLLNTGDLEFETNDILAELFSIVDLMYEVLVNKLGDASPLDTSKPSRKRSSTSTKRSASSGRKVKDGKPNNRVAKKDKEQITIKDPDSDATDAQIGFLKKLLKENDVDFDEGFDLDGEEYWFDELTKGSIQEPIELLKDK
jgi:hypothetical protein